MAIEGVLARQKCAEQWCATLWARVSNILPHRIVKSLICMIVGKLELQCTRNGHQNPQFCPGSPQNTFIIFLRYFKTIFPQTSFPEIENLEIWKSKNPRSLTSAQYPGSNRTLECVEFASNNYWDKKCSGLNMYGHMCAKLRARNNLCSPWTALQARRPIAVY